MAEEEAAAAAESPALVDHKRKLEAEAPEPLTADLNVNAVDSENEEEGQGVAVESEAKRPRLDDKPDDGQSAENGYQEEEKVSEPNEEKEAEELAEVENIAQGEGAQEGAKEALDSVSEDHPAADNHQEEKTEQQLSAEKPTEVENTQEEDKEQPSTKAPSQENVYPLEQDQQPTSDTQTTSRKMEVPNNKVGVLIGKAGDTIRYLQYNSGAKIQITRDADADPHSATRPVELIGTLESISKAEKLIKDVIAEADAGGSPSLVARGFSTVQASGAGEQLMIPVPNEKVGLIIGKGGETIKNLQTRSGARIQLIPQHLPEGDQSKERVVRVTGDKKQIEIAKDMIKEVMNQPIRPSPLSSGYSQQAFRPRGPAAAQWGPRYDYQQRGPYPSQNPQYPPSGYGSYHQQQIAPRGGFGPGWEQRPSAGMPGPPQQAGGYDYYGGQGGHMGNVPASAPLSSVHTHAPGPLPGSAMGMPSSQANYGYGQPQGPDYGHPTPYSQSAPLAQGYGQGYNEGKYENPTAAQPQYGGHGGSHPLAYPQGGVHPGYGPQDQYGKPPSYGMPPQGPHSQSYGQPRANQPGDMPYQGSTQPYGPNVPPQQPYPYTSSGPMQQTYPAYGAAPSADGYGHQPPAGYSQQVGQPASGYVQPGGQQAAGYAQSGQMGGYSSYPTAQPGYTEQPATNNAGYGYQGPTDPVYSAAGPGSTYAAPPAGQPGYTQSAPTQPGYDQSVPQSGGYGNTPAAAGYGKSVSPQPNYPQYDSSQMYGAPR